MIHEKYVKVLDDKITNRIEVLSKGHCENLQQYTHACGEILGLRSARDEFLELLKVVQDLDGEPIA